MEFDTCQYYLTVINSKKIPLAVFSRLLKEFGSTKVLCGLPRSSYQDLGFSNEQIDLLLGAQSKSMPSRSSDLALEWADKKNNHLLCYESSHYPSLLREIDTAPPILFIRGSLAALEGKHFALVGSRKASLYGKKNAYWMAQALSRAGLQICSGMALGIDTKAHEGALDSGMQTIAVVGTGIDRVYPPRNEKLAQRIIENGAIISEFPLATPPYSGNFPRRNRIISGLSHGTLVVEANLKSGSLITARLAMEQNREVFAVPGPIASPQSRGCHGLIKQGAKLVEEPADILEELGVGQWPAASEEVLKESRSSKSDIEIGSPVLQTIGHQGCLFQAIQDECKLSFQELNGQLIQLEAAGLIRQVGGRYFRLD